MLKTIVNTQGMQPHGARSRLPGEQSGQPEAEEGFGDLLALFQPLTLASEEGVHLSAKQGEGASETALDTALPDSASGPLAEVLSELLQALQQALPETSRSDTPQSAFPSIGALVSQVSTLVQQLVNQADQDAQLVQVLPVAGLEVATLENSSLSPVQPERLVENVANAPANFASNGGGITDSVNTKNLQHTLKLLTQLSAKMAQASGGAEPQQGQLSVEGEEGNQPLVVDEGASEQATLGRLPVAALSQMDVEKFAALHQKIQHAKQQLIKLMQQKASVSEHASSTQMQSLAGGDLQSAAPSTQPFTGGDDAGLNALLGGISGLEPFGNQRVHPHIGLEKKAIKADALFQGARLKQAVEAEQTEEGQAGTTSQDQGRASGGLAQAGGKAGSVTPQGMMQTTLSLPVKHPEWGNRLAQRVLFLAQNSQQLAQIRLHPAHLGPIQVKMKLEQDQSVQVSLHAHHALTREAIEQAIPRLKALFAQQGLTLGEIQVQADAQGHAQSFAQMRQAQQPGATGGLRRQSDGCDIQEVPMAPRVAQEGLIDHFV